MIIKIYKLAWSCRRENSRSEGPREHVFGRAKHPHLRLIWPPFAPLFRKSKNSDSEHFWNRTLLLSYVNEQKWTNLPNWRKWRNVKSTCSRTWKKYLCTRAHKLFHVLSVREDAKLSVSHIGLPALVSWGTGQKKSGPFRHVREHVCTCWNTCLRVRLRVFREVFWTPVFSVLSGMFSFVSFVISSCFAKNTSDKTALNQKFKNDKTEKSEKSWKKLQVKNTCFSRVVRKQTPLFRTWKKAFWCTFG